MSIRPIGAANDRPIPPPLPDPPAEEAEGASSSTKKKDAAPAKKPWVAAARQTDKLGPKATAQRADGGQTTAAAPTTPAAQTEALRWAAQHLSSFPEAQRKPAQDKLITEATRTWNGMSPAERAGKSLTDLHTELRKLSTPPVTTAPVQPPAPAQPTPQAQAVARAERLFGAYKDQSQLALDAAHAQGRYDFVDVVGDKFSGKHLNPADMADHVLRLNTAVHGVVDGVRGGQLAPKDFGKKDWSEVDGGSMYNLAMTRLKEGKVDAETEKRMQNDPLWSQKPVMINEPGKTPLPLKQENLSLFNRSPETTLENAPGIRHMFGSFSYARAAEQLPFMQTARNGAVGVADGQTTTTAAQFDTAVALAKGGGVAKNASQLVGSAVQLSGVSPADYKLSTETQEQLQARVKSGEIDGFRTEGATSLTYKTRSPEQIAGDVMKKLDAGELDHLPESTRASLRDVMGGTTPGQKLADSLKSEESKRGWREFGGTAADLLLVGVATGGVGAGAEGLALGFGLSRTAVTVAGTVASSAAFTKAMDLKDGTGTAGQYASDLALFGTLRMASPLFAAAGRLAPGSKAAAWAVRNGTQIAGADAVMTGMDAIRQTASGQTPDAKDAMKQFYENLPMVATLHGANAALAKMKIGAGDAIGNQRDQLAQRFAQGNEQIQASMQQVNDLATQANAATGPAREAIAQRHQEAVKQFNAQARQLDAARQDAASFARRYLPKAEAEAMVKSMGDVPEAPALEASAQPRSGAAGQFVDALKNGNAGSADTTGLVGRILRGTDAADFKELTPEKQRKLVFVMGSDGLQQMSTKQGTAMLEQIGYTPEYIQRKVVDEKNQFKLAVFPGAERALPATWDNVVKLTGDLYPGTGERLQQQADVLKSTSYEKLEQQLGYKLADVDKLGEKDPRFMTPERYLKSPDTAANARAFLYFSGRLTEQYSGDGYSRKADGTRGLREYVMGNAPIDALPGHAVMDIPPGEPAKAQARSAQASAGLKASPAADGIGVTVTGTPQPGTYAARLQEAAKQAQGLASMSQQRAEAFRDKVLPVLTESAATQIFGDPKLAPAMQEALRPAADNVHTLGRMADGSIDTYYPPRAAKALAEKFGEAVGVQAQDTADAMALIHNVAALPYEGGRRGPTLEQVRETLGPQAHETITNAMAALTGEKQFKSLSPKEQALAANLVLNNMTWHATNFQRAADADGKNNNRADVTARNGTFNTLHDNLALQSSAYGPEGAAYMSLMDAAKQGNPRVEAAKFPVKVAASPHAAELPSLVQSFINRPDVQALARNGTAGKNLGKLVDALADHVKAGDERQYIAGDTEGRSLNDFETLKQAGKFTKDPDGGLRLTNPKDSFVFEGDLGDRGPATLRTAEEMLQAKAANPDRVAFVWGNRDLGKLALHNDLPALKALSGEAGTRYAKWLTQQLPPRVKQQVGAGDRGLKYSVKDLNTDANRVQYFLETHSSKDALTFHQQGLEEKYGRKFTPNEAARDYIERWKPGGTFFEFVKQGSFAAPDHLVGDSHIMVHGGLAPENITQVPGRDVLPKNVNETVGGHYEIGKQLIAEAEEKLRAGQPVPSTLLALGDSLWMESAGINAARSNSMIYSQRNTQDGNMRGHEPAVARAMVEAGRSTEIVGHTPIGPIAELRVSPEGTAKVYTDTSFATDGSQNIIMRSGDLTMAVSRVGDEANGQVVFWAHRPGADTQFGKVTKDGFNVVGQTLDGKYYLSKYAKGYKLESKTVTPAELQQLDPRAVGVESEERAATQQKISAALEKKMSDWKTPILGFDKLDQIRGDRTPLVVSGSSSYGSHPATQQQLKDMARSLHKTFRNKLMVIDGGTSVKGRDGEKAPELVLQDEIFPSFREGTMTADGARRVAAMPSVVNLDAENRRPDAAVITGGPSDWHVPLIGAGHYVGPRGGAVIFVGGGGAVTKAIEAARNTPGTPVFLVAAPKGTKGSPMGASDRVAREENLPPNFQVIHADELSNIGPRIKAYLEAQQRRN